MVTKMMFMVLGIAFVVSSAVQWFGQEVKDMQCNNAAAITMSNNKEEC